jgi:hypothetical protein
MKKILSLVVALIVVGYVQANGTSPKSPVGMSVVKSGDVVKLFYRGEKSGKVKVTICNDKGQKVFVEVMRKTEHFMRPYNFSSLPEGNYTIELADEQGVRTEKVNHSSPSQDTKQLAHLTLVNDQEAKYLLAVANAGSDALTVRIFDERNNLLYEETEIVDGNFARLYNLHKVDGNHTFEVTDDDGNAHRLSKPLRK